MATDNLTPSPTLMKNQTAEPALILSLNNVEVIYDHVSLAIKGVSIDVPQGAMVALLGANGAGKSTTLKSISGLLRPERGLVTRGEVKFLGQNIDALAPQERVKLGIVHVLEGRRVFEHMTPDENLVAASAVRGNRQDMLRNKDMVYTYFPRLHQRRTAQSGYLSGGEQQMLAIGRALMTQPKLLMLDEPSLVSRLFWWPRFSTLSGASTRKKVCPCCWWSKTPLPLWRSSRMAT